MVPKSAPPLALVKTTFMPSTCRRLLGLAFVGALMLNVAPASAQTTQAYALEAGDLASRLSQFAQQAGVALVMDSSRLQGLRAPRLRGQYSVQEGFAALLAGQPFQVQSRDQGYVLIAVPDSGALADDAGVQSLASIEVRRNALGDITEGSGTYAAGTIATATRLRLTPRQTPQAISVTTRKKMDDFNLTSIDDVVRHTPGVSIITYDSERTAYEARGFDIKNFQYDGIPTLRDSPYSAGNTLSDMAIYDRVEVLKGASGLLTGSGNPGATINMIRKKPTPEFQGHASAGAGTWDNYRGEVDFSGPLNETGSIRGRMVGAYQDKKSQLDHYQRQTLVLYGIVEADLTPDTRLTLGADLQDNDPKGSTWGGIPINDAQGNFNDMDRSFNNGTRWSRWNQYTRSAFATLEHEFDSGWMAKVQLNHLINGYDSELAAVAAGNPDPLTGKGTSLWSGRYVGKTVSNTADFYATGPFELFGREHELVVGGGVSRRRWTNASYGENSNTDVANYYDWDGRWPRMNWQHLGDDREVTRENGLYVSTRLNLRDDLKLLLGTRYANYNKMDMRETGVWVPYVGAVYDLNDNFSVYASYTNIFQPQDLQDEGGRTLDPLRGDNYEVGVKGEFMGGRLTSSLAYFELRQDNFGKETGGRTPSGGIAYEATQGVRTHGVELEVAGQLTPQWQMHAGYAYKLSRRDGEKVSTLSPEHQFNIYTTYDFEGDLNGLTLGGGARWQSKTWGDVSRPGSPGKVQHTVSGYWLVDAMVRYRFNKNLSATFTVNNLFDKRYYSMFSWYSTYTWGEPRNMMLAVKYQF